MNKKNIKGSKQNNSKPVAKTQTKKNGRVKVGSETVVVLTITEQGRFSKRQSNASSKALCQKLAFAPGKCPKDAPKPKGMEYREPIYHDCVRRMTISAEAIRYYISDDACPWRGKDAMKKWRNATQQERLEANLATTAEGKPFVFEILN